MPPLISLSSDFATCDAYLGQVKGALLSRWPLATLVDLCHGAAPLLSTAWRLSVSWPHFPAGSFLLALHSHSPSILVVEQQGRILIGPDNGVLSLALDGARVWSRPSGPGNFAGRDLFPGLIQDYLSGSLGPPDAEPHPCRLAIASNVVVAVDAFGNVITNIPSASIGAGLSLGEKRITRVAGHFAEIAPGELALIEGSDGTIEIVSNAVSAAAILGAEVGQPIKLG